MTDAFDEQVKALAQDLVIKQITIKKQQATIEKLMALTDNALRAQLKEQLDAFLNKFKGIELPGEITTVDQLAQQMLLIGRDLQAICQSATITQLSEENKRLRATLDQIERVVNDESQPKHRDKSQRTKYFWKGYDAALGVVRLAALAEKPRTEAWKPEEK